jgi:hypothetical protein
VRNLAETFACDNPKFERDRFISACLGDGEDDPREALAAALAESLTGHHSEEHVRRRVRRQLGDRHSVGARHDRRAPA